MKLGLFVTFMLGVAGALSGSLIVMLAWLYLWSDKSPEIDYIRAVPSLTAFGVGIIVILLVRIMFILQGIAPAVQRD